MKNVELVLGDITKIKVDAIVNAANNSLLGGGGVDGAIHYAAGSQLLKECTTLKGCATGSAKITKAYNLPSKFIIHTVGPVWRGGNNNEEKLLISCYHECFKLAIQNGINSIAFPGISTGVYSFPKKRAAQIAINETSILLQNNNIQVYFVAFDDENYRIYERLLTNTTFTNN